MSRHSKTLKFRIGNSRTALQLKVWYGKVLDQTGLSNRTIDNKRIPYFDFTNDNLSKIQEELKFTMFSFNLDKIYIIQSGDRKSYRAICFNKVSYEENIRILMSCPHTIDIHYLGTLINTGKNFIRINPKNNEPIKIINILHKRLFELKYFFPIPKTEKRISSLVHNLFFNKISNDSIPIDKHNDKNTNFKSLEFNFYETVNY